MAKKKKKKKKEKEKNNASAGKCSASLTSYTHIQARARWMKNQRMKTRGCAKNLARELSYFSSPHVVNSRGSRVYCESAHVRADRKNSRICGWFGGRRCATVLV